MVAEVADGNELARAVDQHRPDVVLMDIRMPGMDGLAATELLRNRADPPAVIVLTTFDTDDHILRALRAGATKLDLNNRVQVALLVHDANLDAGDPAGPPA